MKMKFTKLVLFTTATMFVFFVFGGSVAYAATEFISTIDPDNGEGADYTSLSAWEQAVQTDLTASTTLVFAITGHIGTTTDGAIITGQTSGATGTVLHLASTTGQVLIESISGTFQNGEVISTGFGTTTIVATGTQAIAVAKCRSTGGGADTTAVTIDGWTTSSSTYIKIWTDPDDPYGRHNGKWSDSKYRLDLDLVSIGYGIYNTESYTKIDGLQVFVKRTNYGANGINNYPYVGDTTISNNIIKAQFTNVVNSDAHYGIGVANGSGQSNYVYNNIIYDFNDNYQNTQIGIYGSYNAQYIYNNTIYNCDKGIVNGSGMAGSYIANNIVQDSDIYDYEFLAGTSDIALFDNNISSDSTASGTHSKTNTTVSFVDAENDDFHLSTTDTVAKDAGVDLSNEVPFSENGVADIDGQDRYDISWDIGADEAPTILYRSVGLHSAELTSSIANISVATNTASISFANPLPDNVGVGDAIEYGSPTQLAFITGRVSPSAYYIQSATGSAPVATTSVSASVYRAHEHLDDWEDQVVGDVNQSIDSGLQASVLVGQDLVASNTAMFVPCYASTSADDLAVTIDGWNTATSNYIKIYTPVDSDEVGESQRHSGKWSDEKYRILNNIDSTEGNVHFDGLQLEKSLSTGNNTVISILGADHNGSVAQVSNSIIVGDISGDASVNGIQLNSYGDSINVFNCIIYNFDKNSSYGIRSVNGTINVYNTTVYNNVYGIRANGEIKNCVAFNNGDDFYSSSVPDYCASDDGDGTHAVSLASSTAVWDATFVDYENYDFHIKNTSSVLYNAGTSITLFSTDIDGENRPFASVWDIGADELVHLGNVRTRGNIKMRGNIRIR